MSLHGELHSSCVGVSCSIRTACSTRTLPALPGSMSILLAACRCADQQDHGMLEHLNPEPRRPTRVVVAGAAGFVGNAIACRLERDDISVLRLTRQDIDLAGDGAATALAGLLKPGDAFVAAVARAPCKNADMLVENMQIA